MCTPLILVYGSYFWNGYAYPEHVYNTTYNYVSVIGVHVILVSYIS